MQRKLHIEVSIIASSIVFLASLVPRVQLQDQMQIIACDECGLETFFISFKLFLSLEQVSPIIVFELHFFKYRLILKNLNLKKKRRKKNDRFCNKIYKISPLVRCLNSDGCSSLTSQAIATMNVNRRFLVFFLNLLSRSLNHRTKQSFDVAGNFTFVEDVT